MAADQFFEGAFTTDLAEDEILTEIRLPALPTGAGAAYVKLEQPASGYSIVGVAAVLARPTGPNMEGGVVPGRHHRRRRCGLPGDGRRAGTCDEPTARRTAIAAAAAHATDGQTVGSDIHADREYRAAMAKVYTRRAIDAAMARMG